MQQTTIDGVTTFWEQGPDPLTAALVFRVGARHESFRTVQVSHLVEHLVMGTLPKSHLDCNAQVDVDTTTFVATGKPHEVSDFLRRVCDALGDLPLGRLEREQGVLAAEDATSAHPALCWAAGIRFGLTGVGLLNASGAGVKRVTSEQVRSFAAEHFVRENAVLVLTGPPPGGLTLPLSSGPRPKEVAPRLTGIPTPGVMRVAPHPVLSAVLPRTQWASTVVRVLVDRLTDDVRHDRGLAYDINFDALRVDRDRTLFAVFTDGQEEHADAIVETLWGTLASLAVDGPTQAELDHHLAGFVAYAEDPRASVDWMQGVAHGHLHDEPHQDRAEAIASLSAVTVEDVRAWASWARDSAILGCLPAGRAGDRPLAGLPDLTEWVPHAPSPVREVERFGRKVVSLAPRDLSVSVGSDGVGLTVQGTTLAGRWEDVVAVARTEDVQLLHLANGTSLLLSARHHRNGGSLIQLVDHKVGHLAFDSTEEEMFADD
ncbi:M16 family metallopeptidase [Pedococcus bigeumensis]|uniref:M16 family metallopeptidase n=1 Tax=Pedococcus bigeumensis TaxID=433644 RepID=UPI0031CF04D2